MATVVNLYQSVTYQKDLEAALSCVKYLSGLKRSRVLITGAAGLIGSYLTDMLLAYNRKGAGIKIYALGRSGQRLKERFEPAKTEELVYVAHDVREPLELEGPIDYIIHAASNAHPAAFSADPVGTILGNVQGAYELLRFGSIHGTKRFLFVSSGEVYGQYNGQVDSFSETYSGYVDPTKPRSCYPAGKRAAEALCVSYSAQFGLDTVIARPCHTYGPNVTATDNRATVQFMGQAHHHQDVVVNSTGKQLRSYCYVADCASAILTVLLRGRGGEAYNVANPNAVVTIRTFAALAAKQAGQRVVFANPEKIAQAENTPPVRQVLNSQKLEQLGWNGLYNVEEGIEHTLAVLEEAAKAV